jgi:flagellar assembly protein FliH
MQHRKFLFDLSFDGAAHEADEPAPGSAAAPGDARASALAAACAQARAEGFAEGEAAGHAQGLAAGADEAAAATLASFAAIADRLGALLGGAEAASRARAHEAARLALGIARRMVPLLAQSAGFAEIEAVVTDCLRRAVDEPRIVLRVADAEFDRARERIDALAREAGFAGRVIVLAEPEFGPGDCRVEWADGGSERDAERLWREIEGTLARSLAAAALPAASAPPVAPLHVDTRN